MEKALKTIEYEGYTIKIYPDSCDESPREWDNITELHCWHKRMHLGDENYYLNDESDKSKLKKVLAEAKRNRDVIFPLYCYEHSGIALSLSNTEWPFNCPWDAGQVGYVIIRREQMLKEFSAKIFHKALRKKAVEFAVADIKVYNQYLCGDVYGYVVEKDGEDLDSCWGFYGAEYCITEAKSIVDYYVEEEKKELLPFPE